MGKFIDELVSFVKVIFDQLSKCEMDMLLVIGEQVMILFFLMVLQEKGYDVVFYIGWQVGICMEVIYGNVRIIDIDILVLVDQFEKGKIVIVVGF